MKLLKLALCALAISATSVWAGTSSWSSYANYNNGPRSASGSDPFHATSYTTLSAQLYGVGQGGGAAVVIDGGGAGAICLASGSAEAGESISVSDGYYAYSGQNVTMFRYVSAQSSGAYITAVIYALW